MATRPNLVPEDQPWLVLYRDGEVGTFIPVVSAASKAEALNHILEARKSGNETTFFIYGPDSCHEHAVINIVAWERSSGQS